MSVVNRYVDIPVFGRYGCGSYTYKCVCESDVDGIVKIEVFANTLEQAVGVVSQVFGYIAGFSYLNPDVVALNLANNPLATCLLWCG